MLRRRKDSRACPFDRSRVAACGLRLAACGLRLASREPQHALAYPVSSLRLTAHDTGHHDAHSSQLATCATRLHRRVRTRRPRAALGVRRGVHDSQLATHDSRFTIHVSWFTVPGRGSQPAPCALQLAVHNSGLAVRHEHVTSHHSQLPPTNRRQPIRLIARPHVRKFASSPVRRCEEFSDSRPASPRRIPFAHAPASSVAIRPHPGTPVSPHTPSPRHAASPRRKDRATRCARRRRHGRRGPA